MAASDDVDVLRSARLMVALDTEDLRLYGQHPSNAFYYDQVRRILQRSREACYVSFYLSVPYAERTEAKALGAKYDPYRCPRTLAKPISSQVWQLLDCMLDF